MHMNALLSIAHGSRRAASNEEIFRLAEKLGEIDDVDFDIVEPAFLEIAEPDIGTGVKRCVDKGATRVTVVPYFLSAGRHVAEDIPEVLTRASDRFPDIVIETSPHLSASEAMPGTVLATARLSGMEIVRRVNCGKHAHERRELDDDYDESGEGGIFCRMARRRFHAP